MNRWGVICMSDRVLAERHWKASVANYRTLLATYTPCQLILTRSHKVHIYKYIYIYIYIYIYFYTFPKTNLDWQQLFKMWTVTRRAQDVCRDLTKSRRDKLKQRKGWWRWHPLINTGHKKWRNLITCKITTENQRWTQDSTGRWNKIPLEKRSTTKKDLPKYFWNMTQFQILKPYNVETFFLINWRREEECFCSFLNMFEEEGGGLQSHDPSL